MVLSNHSSADYNGKDQVRQKELQNYRQFGEKKRAPGNVMLELRLVLKEIQELSQSLVCTGVKGGMLSGQQPTQLSFQYVEGKA